MNRFTLFGALQYEPTLFDDIALPDNIDKQILIDTIIQHCGDLKPYYQHPLMLKHNITSWFSRMYFSFDKMMGALKSEFNPIENYDRYEERHSQSLALLTIQKVSFMMSQLITKAVILRLIKIALLEKIHH